MRDLVVAIIPVVVIVVIIVLTKQLRKELLEIQSSRQLKIKNDIEEIEFTTKEKVWLVKISLVLSVGTLLFTLTMINTLHIIFK